MWSYIQACETSADSRNSAAGVLSKAVYVISVNSRRKYLDIFGVWGVWAMAGVQGKVAFGLSHFCIEVFQKKF